MEATAVAPSAQSAPFVPERGKSAPVLMPERMGLREQKINDFVVDVPMTLSLEDALEPSFWAHVADQMQPSDHITLRADDGSWIAYLVVAYCERNFAKVVVDRCVKLNADTETPINSIKHKVEWKGPRLKYCVIRMSDAALLKQECRTREEAAAWMREHEQTMAR